jgi:outer membrane protein OmpA-like peptidoglycan-associated protein
VPRFALLVVLLLSGLAGAQSTAPGRHFDLVPTKATAAHQSGITLESATPGSTKSLMLSLLLDWNVGILAWVQGNQKLGDVVPYRIDLHLIGAYQLHPRVELAVDLPAALAQGDNFSLLNQYGLSQPGVSGGIGDIRLLPRLILFPADDSPLGVALVTELRLPTGNGQNLLGERGPVFAPRLVLERPIGPFRLLANFGARLRKQAQLLNLVIGSEYTLGLGAMYHLPDLGRFSEIHLMAEMQMATPTSGPFTLAEFADTNKAPWEVLGGLRGKFSERWGAELAVGRGIAAHSGYGRETFRALASIRYEFDLTARRVLWADSDGDGIADSEDACPNQPGPAEYDGCPDTDGDQVPDNLDKCPTVPGPAANGGCPYLGPPYIVLHKDRIEMRGSVLFDLGQAVIQKQSFPLLDELAALLKSKPEIDPLTVEGHTDNRGGRGYNQDLSERRAKAVVDYLVKKSIQARRLRSRGFGFDQPVASNSDALGRAQNRRVAFQINKAPAQTAATTH